MHHPDNVAKKKQREQSLAGQKSDYHDVLAVVRDTCDATGWEYDLDNYDPKYYRYATVTVKRSVKTTLGYDKVIGEFYITVDDGVKIRYRNTSHYSYGLEDLRDSIMSELDRLPWIESSEGEGTPDPDRVAGDTVVSGDGHDLPKEIVCKLLARFHFVAIQLTQRHDNRPTIKIEDEYDVQDLLRSLLKIYFDDIRPEEPSPSRGGASSRLDLLLKNEQIVVEVKMATAKLTDKKIGEQLIIDIARYRAHPNCRTLICFVYDPEGQIRNPTGLKKDLSTKEEEFEVRVLIVPK